MSKHWLCFNRGYLWELGRDEGQDSVSIQDLWKVKKNYIGIIPLQGRRSEMNVKNVRYRQQILEAFRLAWMRTA